MIIVQTFVEIGGRVMVEKMVGVMGFLEGNGMEEEVLRLLVTGRRTREDGVVGKDEFDVALDALRQMSIVNVNVEGEC